jgi:hypothetical protein
VSALGVYSNAKVANKLGRQISSSRIPSLAYRTLLRVRWCLTTAERPKAVSSAGVAGRTLK